MADEERDKPRPFDVRTVRYLVRLMGRYDLSEIDLQEGDERIRIRRGARRGEPAAPGAPPLASSGAAPVKPAAEQAPAPAGPPKKLLEIKSPTVGTFYAQREPGSPPYVSVGSRVTPSTVVCIIEAMKVYNEIQAECSGVVAEVLVKDKDFVEYGTVLFRVDPAG